MILLFALLGLVVAQAASPVPAALCPFQKSRAEKLFSHEIQHQMGIDGVEEIFREKAAAYGACRKLVRGRKNQWLMHTPQGVLPLELQWKKGKISDFFFAPAKLNGDTLELIGAFGAKSFPRFSLYFSRDGVKVFAVHPDIPLNVSRSAQLFLLRALRRQIDAGKKSLGEVERLGSTAYSFGPLQQWPSGTQLTLDALRGFALIERDTAASDLLLRAVGRERVEAEGAHLKPFLSFREVHQIMAHAKPVELAEGADLIDLAKKASARGPEPEGIPGNAAFARHLGWFATTEELCRVIGEMSDDAMLRRTMVSEGAKMAFGKDWQDVISVQAREAGVAQSTLWLRGSDGKQYCLAITANGEREIPETTFYDLNQRILAAAKAGKAEGKTGE